MAAGNLQGQVARALACQRAQRSEAVGLCARLRARRLAIGTGQLAKHLRARGFADGDDGGVGQSSLGGDRIQLFRDGIDATDDLDSILIADVVGDCRRRDEEPGSGLSERLEQRAVVELANDARMQPLPFEPLFKARADGDILAGHQERGAVEQRRESAVESLDQGRCRENRQAALAEQVAVAAYIEIGGHRPVGDDHVQTVDGQLGEQRGQAAFATDQPHRFRQVQRRFDQPIGDRFRHRVGDADGEWQALARALVACRIEQFVSEREDLLGVAENAPAGVGQFEAASDPAEQRDAETVLEFAQLAADRLRRQVQLLAGAGDRARFGDGPEVTQMLVVERSHAC